MTQPQESASPSTPRPLGVDARNPADPRTSDRAEHESRSRKRGLLRIFWEILEGMSA